MLNDIFVSPFSLAQLCIPIPLFHCDSERWRQCNGMAHEFNDGEKKPSQTIFYSLRLKSIFYDQIHFASHFVLWSNFTFSLDSIKNWQNEWCYINKYECFVGWLFDYVAFVAHTHTKRMTIVKAKRHQSKANLDFKNKRESNIAVVHLIWRLRIKKLHTNCVAFASCNIWNGWEWRKKVTLLGFSTSVIDEMKPRVGRFTTLFYTIQHEVARFAMEIVLLSMRYF